MALGTVSPAAQGQVPDVWSAPFSRDYFDWAPWALGPPTPYAPHRNSGIFDVGGDYTVTFLDGQSAAPESSGVNNTVLGPIDVWSGHLTFDLGQQGIYFRGAISLHPNTSLNVINGEVVGGFVVDSATLTFADGSGSAAGGGTSIDHGSLVSFGNNNTVFLPLDIVDGTVLFGSASKYDDDLGMYVHPSATVKFAEGSSIEDTTISFQGDGSGQALITNGSVAWGNFNSAPHKLRTRPSSWTTRVA